MGLAPTERHTLGPDEAFDGGDLDCGNGLLLLIRRHIVPLPRLAVTGIGSWPRPRWLLYALHRQVQGQLAEAAFHEAADDAVRLVVSAQQRAGATLLTDGEQRRDSYASFVATR